MSNIRIGLIGGSGLGAAMAAQTQGARHEIETPFGRPSDAIVETRWNDLPLFFLARHGPGHLLNPSQVPYRANIFALKQLGVTHILASGAVGSLREEFHPRHLVIPDQVIDRTAHRPATFYERAAVHVEFAEPFCPVLRQMLLEAAADLKSEGVAVHDAGCYVAMEGPAFSTRAESLMHRLMGGDLVGMTAMPEARLAREAEIAYALVALVTDYDCWKDRKPTSPDAAPDRDSLLREILGHLEAATDNAIRLIRRTVERIASRGEPLPPSPAHEALRLGIWSDKRRIPQDERDRLGVLWMKHFTEA